MTIATKRVFGVGGVFILLSVMLAGIPAMGQTAPRGVVLFNAEHASISRDQVSSRELRYYSWPRGPYIENKYSAFRLLLSAKSIGGFDPFSKKQYVSVLPYFNDPKYDKGAMHEYGSDIYHVGDMAGIGSPMFKAGKDWVMLPFFDKTDSIVIEILDASVATPRYRITCKGWAIDDRQKIDVELEVYTFWEDRHIHVQMKVTGFSGRVGVGMQGAEDVALIKDSQAATMYNFGVFQKQEMLQAVHAAPAYFDSFETDDQGEVMALKSDASGVVRWSFLHSWGEEPRPLFKETDWQRKLVYRGPSASAPKAR